MPTLTDQATARRRARELTAETGLLHLARAYPFGAWGGTEQGWTIDGPSVTPVTETVPSVDTAAPMP